MNEPAAAYLRKIISAQRNGRTQGIMSVCSANRFVIEAAMHQSENDGTILLVESTANQVNQFGGYTGMTPKDFAAFVMGIADGINFPKERILLGGDHIGPGPWQTDPAEKAMGRALELVQACIEAGYGKIHLDASPACMDDTPPNGLHLPIETAAQRSALLCRAAEAAALPDTSRPMYVIGTDVPHPGGMLGEKKSAWVSRISDVEHTISETQKSFHHYDLEEAWYRTEAVVVQPGVDFGAETVITYDRERVKKLVGAIKSGGRFVFEAHATDYQTPSALREMVEDRFTILKVGPALTFAFREALTALAHIEAALLAGRHGTDISNLRHIVDQAMENNPTPWIKYHGDDDADVRTSRYFSFSDRVRYYWPLPELQASIQRLLKNLATFDIPLPLISQYLPNQYEAILQKRLRPTPEDLIRNKIMEITARYSTACRGF
jgi:D-tagatose-1,6-bisphosphate aldolase subunit GatZ/KbaZ